ncbi:MAG: patatin-like phospholipase family protein, partial [Actinomycetes bacterium]
MATTDFRVPPPRPLAARRSEGLLAVAELLPKPVTFALAGGGAHGSVQWGLLQALAETDVRADSLIGTSAGALTGVIMAEDPLTAVSRLAYVWSQLDLQDVLGDGWLAMLRSATTRKPGLADNASVAEVLSAILVARDFDELDVPFAAVCTDLATGLPVALETGALIPALLASSAIPGVLPPVEIEGRLCIDGLASANLPALLAVRRGAGSVVVLDTGSRAAQPEVSTSAAKIAARVSKILGDAQRRAQLQAAAQRVPVILLPTPSDLGGALDFHGTIDAAASAYELGRAFLSDLAAQY